MSSASRVLHLPQRYYPGPVYDHIMATVFTRIIDGDIPGAFVWRDEVCVAFLSINPIRPGHTLVVPIAEVDHWLDLSEETAAHLIGVARRIGGAIQRAFNPERVGLIVAGFEVPHTHIHLIPCWSMSDLDFKNAAPTIGRPELEASADAILGALD